MGEDAELVEMMLKLDKSNINRKNGEGSYPILGAASKGRHVISDILIRNGADMRVLNGSLNAGSLAAVFGNLEVLNVLIENGMGADESTGDIENTFLLLENKRPIHYAAEYDRTEVVKYLLSKGANPTRRFGTMFEFLPSATAYRLAKMNGHEETVKVLEQAAKEWKQKG
jgi:ankyrin repeat protein